MTSIRYRMLTLACALSMITYLDRVCFGVAAPDLARDLDLAGVADLKWAFTSFAIAYAVFEIPSGWLGDVWGPRGTLIRIVLWWSACTVLTGMVGLQLGGFTVGGLGLLVAIRFLFGAGEAGAYPNITRALHNWFPVQEWATAQGFVWMAGRLMGGLTPLIWMLLVTGTAWTPGLVNWRGAFYLFGAMGLAWCTWFALVFRNTPAEHPAVNPEERAWIGARTEAADSHAGIPWRAMLTSRNLWLLCGMYFCVSYGWYFNITYLTSFIREQFHVDDKSLLGALYKGGPLWVGAIGCLSGGMLSDWLVRRLGDRRKARRMLGMTAHSICALGWIAAAWAPSVHLFFLATSVCALATDLTMGSAWATCQDIGRRYAAVTAAAMNTIGTFGAAAAGWLVGAILEQAIYSRALALDVAPALLPQVEKHAALGSGYTLAFYTFAGAYVCSAICWAFIDSTQPLVADESPEPTEQA